MKRRLLNRYLLDDFLKILHNYGEVHAPVNREDGVVCFRPVTDSTEIYLEYQRTLIPPKKYLLPPEETILSYNSSDGYRAMQDNNRQIVLLGLHPCDLAGIAYLDQVFLNDQADPWYEGRRSTLILIGLSCEPDEFCSCSPTLLKSASGFDLFMNPTDAGFALTSGTDKGNAILEEMQSLITMVKDSEPDMLLVSPNSPLPPENVSLETYAASSLWHDFAERCLSCGACSACCPTCYCFSMLESKVLQGETCTRMRTWDNCLFKSHGEVSGGINFRPTRLERLQYRFQHKYCGFGPLRGMSSCTGCGRCREVCPVAIDLLDIFRHNSKQNEEME